MSLPLPQRLKNHRFYTSLYSRSYEPLRFHCRRLLARGVRTVSFGGITARFSFRTPIELERLEECDEPRHTEADFLLKYLQHVSQANVIYDIGANIGIFTILAAVKAKDHAVVHAFEPEVNNCSALAENVALNGLSNVRIHQLAVGASASLARLVSPSRQRGVGTHRIGVEVEGTVAEGGLSVRVNSIDNLVDEGVIPSPDVVKIDVEGHEFQVLQGMRRTVSVNPPVVFLEFHEKLLQDRGKTREDLEMALNELGLEITDVLAAPNRSETHFLIGSTQA